MWPRGLRLDPDVSDPFAPLFMQLEQIARRAHEFDIAAIRIAAQAGMKLKITAKVDRADREYFTKTIEPLLDSADVEFVGENW